MSENLETTGEKHVVARDEQGRILPGHTGNPNGRPKGTISLTTKIKALLEETPPDSKETFADLIVRRITRMALEGDQTMLKLMWNYLDGMPKFSGEIEHKIPQNLIDMFKHVQSGGNQSTDGEDQG